MYVCIYILFYSIDIPYILMHVQVYVYTHIYKYE